MLDIISWHDLTQQDHAHQVEFYSAQGYRLLSLSVYNTPQDPWYACVTIRRSVPVSEQNFWTMSEAQFTETLGRMSTQNMAPHIVSATGPTDSAVFAASFISAAAITPAPVTQHGLTADQFKAANQQAGKSGLKLVWFDCYGTPTDERYVAVWWPDPEMIAWSCEGIGEAPAAMQERFDGLTKTWARMCHCVATPSGGATSLYSDGSVGKSRAGFSLSGAEYCQ